MKLRTRKFLGIVLTIVWISAYALVAMTIGGIYMLGRGIWLELPFYIFAGLAWIPVEQVIIRWMSTPDPS